MADKKEDLNEEGNEEAGDQETSEEKIARLESENETLRSAPPVAAATTDVPKGRQGTPTSKDLESLDEAAWDVLEKKYGTDRQTILSRVENMELKQSQANTNSRLNVQDVLDDEVEKDPKTVKLKAGIKEYLNDLPLEVRSDREKLETHLAKAKTYALGKLAEKNGGHTSAPGEKKKIPISGGKPGQGGEPVFEDDDDDETVIKPGDEGQVGKFKLKVSNLVPEDIRKQIKHPEDPNGVQFKDFDKKPAF